MKYTQPIVLLATFFCLLAIQPARGDDQRLDDGLIDAEGFVAVFVRMEDQLFSQGGDYELFCEQQPRGTKRLELRKRVVAGLKKRADRDAAAVDAELKKLIDAGEVRGVQRYWIINGFACEATDEGRRALAAMEPVGFVYRQRYGAQHRTRAADIYRPIESMNALYRKLSKDRVINIDVPFDAEGLEVPWNLEAIRADRVWRENDIAGKGVVVAVLDDGMMAVPALLPSLWRNPKEQVNGKDDDGNGYIDDVFGYNFMQDSPYAVKPLGHRHGTLCAGVIAGRPTGGEEPIATGVAPRARIMPLVGNGQLRAYEYALEHGADVLSMSYTFEPTKMGQYRGLYRTAHEHLSAAGIVSVGGAGNYAQRWPVGKQIGSPKDIPCVIAAGGVGVERTVSAFSSRGPVSWKGIRYYDDVDDERTLLIKPDVTACNADFPMWTHKAVWTGTRAGRLKEVVYEDEAGYVFAIGPRGNSFSGPHAAGVAALMLEANPDLPVWHLQRLMQETCKDMGEPGLDATYGAGLLQADRAVEAAIEFKAK
ncbi:MAG: S8 family serine peptidase [Phycisphaeraceae bacterium]